MSASLYPYRFFEGGALPSYYKADGNVILLETDFRCWLRYEWIMNNDDLTDEEKAISAIAICCIDEHILKKISGVLIMDALAWFYSCADIERRKELKINDKTLAFASKRPVRQSLYWDFRQLWSSFKQQYDIDLYACGFIHWWEFRRLLDGLKSDTPLLAIKYLRGLTKAEFQHNEKALKHQQEKDWADIELEQMLAALPGQGDE